MQQFSFFSRIINGNYAIPTNDGKYECFHELIRGTLKVDPSERFRVSDILERLAAIGETKGFSMKAPIQIECKKIDLTTPGKGFIRLGCFEIVDGLFFMICKGIGT